MSRFFKNSLLVCFGFVFAYAGGDIYTPPIVQAVNKPVVNSGNCFGGNCDKNSFYVDKKTKLMWEDIVISPECDGAYSRENSGCKSGSFAYAANFCANLNYASYSDWRLPNSDELMEVSKQDRVFKNNRGADFWTSTPSKYGRHYVVYTVDGFRYDRPDSQSNYIRCVRCVTDKKGYNSNLDILNP